MSAEEEVTSQVAVRAVMDLSFARRGGGFRRRWDSRAEVSWPVRMMDEAPAFVYA